MNLLQTQRRMTLSENCLQKSVLQALFLVLLLLGVGSANANSLILVELATVSSVKLVVPTGGLRYRPLKGIDLVQLEHSIRTAVGKILKEGGIEVLESSDQHLIIEVKYLRGENPRTEYPFMVITELCETATLTRGWSHAERDEAVWITTWRDFDLNSAPLDRFAEKVVKAAEFGVEHFVEKVSIARSYYEKERAGQ